MPDDKLWGGRFESAVDPAIHRYTAALAFDRRLARQDLVGSLAHARMLWETGVLESEDAAKVLAGLSAMLTELDGGELAVEGDDEDTHSWIERLLAERIGDAARRLHTGRSRNDQTCTALRLWVRDASVELRRLLVELGRGLLERAGSHVDTRLPGYTHLQRGQPVSLAHHLLAHFWSLEADGERVERVYDSSGVSSLGAGARYARPPVVHPCLCAARAPQSGSPTGTPTLLRACGEQPCRPRHPGWRPMIR